MFQSVIYVAISFPEENLRSQYRQNLSVWADTNFVERTF